MSTKIYLSSLLPWLQRSTKCSPRTCLIWTLIGHGSRVRQNDVHGLDVSTSQVWLRNLPTWGPGSSIWLLSSFGSRNRENNIQESTFEYCLALAPEFHKMMCRGPIWAPSGGAFGQTDGVGICRIVAESERTEQVQQQCLYVARLARLCSAQFRRTCLHLLFLLLVFCAYSENKIELCFAEYVVQPLRVRAGKLKPPICLKFCARWQNTH